jgi:TetR/AcrR family fatty acid metabolism transcriptional regulator
VASGATANVDKKQLILAAAVRVFAHEGYHTSRVGRIAEEAGVAYGLVYHYFGSKDELLETIFRQTWTDMLARVREVEESGRPAREQIRQVAAVVLRTWRRDPDLVRVLVREVIRSEHLQHRVEEIADAFRGLERIIRSGQERGELRRDLDARLASVVLYGALEEILSGWVLGQLPGSEDDILHAENEVVDILCGGLGAE